MKRQEMKEKLKGPEYDFLRKDPHLKNNIILLTLGGSHSYGTNIETSDLDIRGIALNTKADLLGLSKFDQYESGETDSVIYSIRKAMTGFMECNPNMIEIIGTKREDIFEISKVGEMLRDNVKLFLSRRAIKTFSGYATQQLRRVQNALARDQYSIDEKETHILKSLERQMYHFEEHYHDMNPGYIKLSKGPGVTEGYEEEILVDISLEKYPLRSLAGIYSEMANVIKDYDKINHRNNKKTESGLNKHKMHLIRLLHKGIQVISKGEVETHCGDLVPMLMEIRNGNIPDVDFFNMVNDLEKEYEYAAANTILPNKPRVKEIEELLIEINMTAINKEV